MLDFTARKSPDYLSKAVIYQISVRAFTNEGTLNAAAEMLPHLKSIGVDIVYLWPVFVHDTDENRDSWSARQLASGMNNPKNPYRMMDYFHVDPEYGTDDDLRAFIRKAHSLEMRVMLDLVYFHCGPNAVFLADHPDFIMRDPDGKPTVGSWKFPRLNFDCPELREYLWDNMTTLVRDFGCDGFRCDVGDAVPTDFWEEGRRRIEAIKPDVVMLNEGEKPEHMRYAFDLYYDYCIKNFFRPIYYDKSTTLAEKAKNGQNRVNCHPRGILFFDQHDIANNDYDKRWETVVSPAQIETILFAMYTMEGVPFLYCGNEIADDNRHSIWSNREHAANLTVDWQNALTEKGKRRMNWIRTLNALHKLNPALYLGSMEFIESTAPEALLCWRRDCEEQHIVCAINMSDSKVETVIDASAESVKLLQGGEARVKDGKIHVFLQPYACIALEIK